VTAADDDDDALQQYLSLELHTIEDISAEVFVWRNNTRVEKYYIYVRSSSLLAMKAMRSRGAAISHNEQRNRDVK
jgi:hypothetical protein